MTRIKTRDVALPERIRRSRNYLPNHAEIRAACLAIQQGWSFREKLVRAGLFDGGRRWTVPEVRCGTE
jgi:hypothetical protein